MQLPELRDGRSQHLVTTKKMVLTNDDWYPNYITNSLAAELSELGKCEIQPWTPKNTTEDMEQAEHGMVIGGVTFWIHWDLKEKCHRLFIRICFWGADDTGIEKDYYLEIKDFEEAVAIYERESRWLNNLFLVEREVLFNLGYVWA